MKGEGREERELSGGGEWEFLLSPSILSVTIQWMGWAITVQAVGHSNTPAQLSLVFRHTHLLCAQCLSLPLALSYSLSFSPSLSLHLSFPPSSGSPNLWPTMFAS